MLIQNFFTNSNSPLIPHFQEISQFFGNLSQITREVVFVPTVHYDSGLQTYNRLLRKKQWANESLDVFRTRIEVSVIQKYINVKNSRTVWITNRTQGGDWLQFNVLDV